MTDFSFSPEAPADEELVVPTEGTYVLNEDHVLEGISHLIEFFRYGPRNQAVLTAILDQVQELENAFWVMQFAFDPNSASGDQLLKLGAIVGEPQLGRTDEEYRAAIRVRIKINRSNGKAAELYEIGLLMLPDVLQTITEYAPMSLVYEFRGDLGDVTLETLARSLRQAKLGGVRLDAVHALEDADSFPAIWAEDDEVDLVYGWGIDTDDSDSATGGTWSSVL